MKILVIGGTRFIGPPTISALQSSGHEVARFSRGQSTPTEYTGDRTDASALQSALSDFKPDAILDMCAYFEPQIDVLLDVAKDRDLRLLMVSSCDVYRQFGGLLGLEQGQPNQSEVTEISPLRTNLYPYSTGESIRPGFEKYDKIPLEEKVLAAGGVVARLPMVYGVGDKQYRTFGTASQMAAGRKTILIGQKNSEWKTTRGNVLDIANGLRLALENGKSGEIYNLAESFALTEKEWIEAIGKSLGWTGEIVTIEETELPDDLIGLKNPEWHLVMDTTKARNELGYSEQVAFETGLKATVEWELANPPSNHEPPNYELIDQVLAAKRGVS